MNARVLELIQRPENISKEDITLLQKEISKYPYMQSIRTLQLSAIFNFEAENYQKELTKTAAYTTDKKILYQFINKKAEEEKKDVTKFKKIVLAKTEIIDKNSNVTEAEIGKIEADKPVITHPKNVIGDTELETPILEKRENEFDVLKEEKELEMPQNAIGDTELETPILEKKENEFEVFTELQELEEEISKREPVFKTREEDLNFSKETLLENIKGDKEITSVKPSDISFSGFDSFLPDVKFTVPSVKREEQKEEVSIPKIEEKLIIVEAKNEEVSFESVQNFEIPQPIKAEAIETKEVIAEEEKIAIIPESEIHFEWKPMNFVMNPLDSTIKKAEFSKPKTEEKSVENKVEFLEAKEENKILKEELKTEISEQEKENERSLLSGTFLNEKVQETKAEVSTPINVTEEKTSEIQPKINQSNIPSFVDTWQNWLKIDRSQPEKPTETIPVKVIEKKAEIIDKFIEENPKISQLKEETHFVVKEKAEDISHLMTETLAKLYTSQKLFSKAIKAYEILQKKHPEKTEEFEAKINEIKELKQGK